MVGYAATIPFLVLLALALWARRPLWQSGAAAFILASILWISADGVGASDLGGPCFKAFIVSCEVGLILLGAIAFLEYSNRIGATDRIQSALSRFTTDDPAMESLLLAWLFCGFLEGAAGFGAPAALVAPLLVAIGFPPVLAAVLCLIGDSAAVPFGAVGTPVRIGFDGLPAESAAHFGAGINVIAGLVAPVAIYLLANRWQEREGRSGSRPGGILLALWAGLCFTVPAFAFSWIGPEFPSLAGSLLGFLVFCLTLSRTVGDRHGLSAIRDLFKALSPYLLVCLLLLVGKLTLGDVRMTIGAGENAEKVGAFQPGAVFLVAIGLLALWRRDVAAGDFRRMFSVAGSRLPKVWLAIFFLAGLAQLVVQLGNPGVLLGTVFDGPNAGILLLVFAPLAGLTGSFVAGSATVSNLLFAPFLVEASELTGMNPGLVLGLQLAGAGAGNMISLQNLAAVQATVGLAERERDMLRLLWWPCGLYVIIVLVQGLFLHWWGAG